MTARADVITMSELLKFIEKGAKVWETQAGMLRELNVDSMAGLLALGGRIVALAPGKEVLEMLKGWGKRMLIGSWLLTLHREEAHSLSTIRGRANRTASGRGIRGLGRNGPNVRYSTEFSLCKFVESWNR